MKKCPLLLILLLPIVAAAQVKLPKEANRFTYYQFDYGSQTDTTSIDLLRQGQVVLIPPSPVEGRTIPGFAQTTTTVDYILDSITTAINYPDSDSYYYRTPFSRSDIEWTTERRGSLCTYTCSINSNTLTFVMDEGAPYSVNPLPYYGLNRGVLLSFTRNGQKLLELASATRDKKLKQLPTQLPEAAHRVSPQQMERLRKERLVITTRIFDHERIYWGAENAHIEGGYAAIPTDTVLHFAGGTLILRRLHLPEVGAGYQTFVEMHQQSNGDAYDRTGSLFVVSPGFFDGINQHPDSMPSFIGRDGERYQGMVRVGNFAPALEWVRFFTPFGIGHFNNRLKLDGLEWRNEAYYKQEITDIYHGGDIVIGAWIGNYSEGHLLTVDVKSYPNSYQLQEAEAVEVLPLFNTCNVLEMAGQNYGKLFGTDSLRVRFTIPEGATAMLRYISTGHGGWGEGDEFVPKSNTLLIDGHPAYTHTPWRGDCGTYRELNPVSGNFWNGLSSSDLSRSGWCPGTATQPVYFDLSLWADGREHTLTVAIPQGQPVEGMFSHWGISGQLIIHNK